MTIAKWKEFGLRFNAGLEKYMLVIMPVSMIVGFLFSGTFRGWTVSVPFLFACITYIMAFGSSFRAIAVTMHKPGPLIAILLLTHVCAPAVAYGLGTIFFGAHSPYLIGLVLYTIIPLSVSSIIWIGLSGGSVPLALSMIIIDSALSPLVVPAEISLLFGSHISFDVWRVMKDLLIIIVIPTFLGLLTHKLTHGRAKPVSAPITAPLSKLFLFAVVMINAAAIAPQAGKLKEDWPVLLPAVALLVAFCYILGFAGLIFRRRDVAITLLYTSGMRNISLGLVLAIGYFEPGATLAVMLSTLIHQPMANVMYSLLRFWTRRSDAARQGIEKPS